MVRAGSFNRPRLVAWYESYGFVRNDGEAEREKASLKFLKRRNTKRRSNAISMRFDIRLTDEIEGGEEVREVPQAS